MDTAAEPQVGPLELDEEVLLQYNRLILHRIKHPQPSSPAERDTVLSGLKKDSGFQRFLSTLNIDDLERKLIKFGKDSPLVDLIEKDLLKYLKQELPKRFEFPGQLCRVGSCEDGSKVGQVDEVDTLYVITADIQAEKLDGNNYDLYSHQKLLKPLELQSRMADVVDDCLAGWKWGDSSLIHGGYLSPKFSGVRYNGPAATVVLIHKGKDSKATVLSLDITVAFPLPITDTFTTIENDIQRKFRNVKLHIDDKLLKLDGVHLVPNVSTDKWQVTTAAAEALLFRDLNELAPMKRAYSFLKILNSDWKNFNHANAGLFSRLTDSNDKTETLSEQILEYQKNKERVSDKSMRHAHAFLPNAEAEKVNECGKSDLSYNNAALKHILLDVCLEDPNMFLKVDDSASLQDEVYRLVVKVVEVLCTRGPDGSHIRHTLLEEASINIYSLSKRAIINETHSALQTALVEECKMVFQKIKIKKWSLVTQFKTDKNGTIDEDLYRPVNMEDLRYPEYMYRMEVDLSISPDRNTMAQHLLNLTNALMNTCGGVLTIQHGRFQSNISVFSWMKRLNKIFANHDLKVTIVALPTKSSCCVISVEQKSGSKNFPSSPENFPSSPENFPSSPENFPSLPENFPSSPGNFLSSPENFPSSPEESSDISQEINIFVKPSPEHVWLKVSEQTQLTFNILQNGRVKYVSQNVSHTTEQQASAGLEQERHKEIDILAEQPSTTSGGKTPTSSPPTDVDVTEALRQARDLSLMEQHKHPWEDYIEVEPATINERIETMSAILNLSKPLSVLTNLSNCPNDLRQLILNITTRYRNRTGFAVWFDGYNSVFENVSQTTNNAYLLCFTTDDPTFELWSLRDGDSISRVLEIGRNIKWLIVNTLRIYTSMCIDDNNGINLTITCHWSGADGRTGETNAYPLCQAAPTDEAIKRLCAAFAEVVIKHVKCPSVQKSLVENLLLSLTLDQCQHLVSFAQHQLNYIEGPPGSGKSVIGYYLCDICNKKWKSKPTYLCASPALKAILDSKDKCHAEVVDPNKDLTEYISDMKDAGKQCLIVDDVQNIACSEGNWTRLIEEVVRRSMCMYVFTDNRYQNFQSHASLHLAYVMFSVATKHCVSYNISYLTKVHRNSQKVVSFIGAGFSENKSQNTSESSALTPPKIACGHNEVGDDVHLVKVQKLQVFSEENGLLQYIRSILSEYQPSHIAVMIDSDNAEEYISQTTKLLKNRLQCDVHGTDIYPKKGVTVDHLDSFVGVDATVCLYPVLPKKTAERQIENAKYRAFVASRSILRLVLLTENFAEELSSQFQLDPHKLITLTSPRDFSSAVISQKYSGQGEVYRGGFKPWAVAVCPVTGRVILTDWSSHKIHVLTGNLQQEAVFGGGGQAEGKYRFPRGVCVNSRGDSLYISDRDNHRVQVTDVTGQVKFVISETTGTQITRFSDPWGLTIHDNHIYLCDLGNSRVVVMTEVGEYIREFSLPRRGPGAELPVPWDIAVSEQCVAVCDMEGDIYLLTPEGELLHTLTHTDGLPRDFSPTPGIFGSARGVCFDAHKHLVLTSWNPDSVHVISNLGCSPAVSCITQGLRFPEGVTVLPDHSLMVCNPDSSSLVKFTVCGQNS